jgi:uncharacterized protein YecT (DUF1311 family)
MQCNTMNAARCAVLLFLAAVLPALAQNRPFKITEDEIKQHLNLGSDCEISIDSLEYFDFTGDGIDEAIMVASTCATGTAGPDVHAVLSRQSDGTLTELKVHRPSEKLGALLGRVFHDLNVRDGLLIETFHDSSGRKDPLVIQYRWNAKDKEFQPVDVKVAPRYKTSFDCDKARNEIEHAICYSFTVAILDVKVDAMYKGWLDQLNDADSDVLVREQKEWLKKRDLICGPGWDIVHCLETLYRARLLELGAFKFLHPPRVESHF